MKQIKAKSEISPIIILILIGALIGVVIACFQNDMVRVGLGIGAVVSGVVALYVRQKGTCSTLTILALLLMVFSYIVR